MTQLSPMTELPPMDFGRRAKKVWSALEEDKLDSLLITSLDNIRWLTGFSGSAGRLVVTPEKMTLVTDGRYSGQAEKEVRDCGADTDAKVEVVIENAKQKEAILSALKAGGDTSSSARTGTFRLGLEADDLTWATFRALESDWFESDTELVPTTSLIGELRRQKDAGEVARIQRASEIADLAYQKVISTLAEDGQNGTKMTEREVARELESVMLDSGAEGISFETIVATADHSAWAHARPGDREIESGELLLIDMGALVEGYHSDMTRTCLFDTSPSEDVGSKEKTGVKSNGRAGSDHQGVIAKMYEVVESAQQAGLDAVKAGVSCKEVDKACREVIESAGWGDAFTHSTGHGVGLNIHESPSVSSKSEEILLEGEAVTVEPGVYISPYGGVRIEDLVLVTANGCEVLTKSPKHFLAF